MSIRRFRNFRINKKLFSIFVDKDECDAKCYICRENSICVNLEGSYTCLCKKFSEDKEHELYFECEIQGEADLSWSKGMNIKCSFVTIVCFVAAIVFIFNFFLIGLFKIIKHLVLFGYSFIIKSAFFKKLRNHKKVKD